jgi:short-subunit dehydrogenase/acyl carrier protein
LGGIGLLVARWLADHGARHLVLLGRRAPNDDALRAIDEMERQGVSVVAKQADVSDRRQMLQVMDLIQTTMPPLKGIMHAAGVLDDGVLLQQDWSRFQRVMAPKVRGALHLEEMTRGMDLDWMVIFSSVASLWGSPGQGNYAAANAALDAIAHARRQTGLPALAINWGPWSEVGMAARMELGASRHWWEVVGIGMIPPTQGMTVLEMLLNENTTQVAVMPMDWSKLLAQLPRGTAPPLVKELLQSQQKALEPSKEWLEFVQLLTEAPPAERVDLLVKHIQDEAGRVLGLDPDSRLDPYLPLNELGFDSLMAVELANQLTAATGIALPVTLLFDYPTLHAISGYIVQNVLGMDVGDPPDSESGDQKRSAQPDLAESLLRSIGQLTDDEVAERIGI